MRSHLLSLHCDCIAFNTKAKGIRKTITEENNIYLKTTCCRKSKEHMIYRMKLKGDNNETAMVSANYNKKQLHYPLFTSFTTQASYEFKEYLAVWLRLLFK
jgi:hypothetical protein